jgi:ABC-type transport system involved in cytochrome c biogenesis permease subunit
MLSQHQQQGVLWGIKAGMVVVALPILGLTYLLFSPLVADSRPGASNDTKVQLPAYEYHAWHALPVQSGRTMPFESACIANVRQITGKSKFEGKDPVAVVLTWMMFEGQKPKGEFTDWESYPFILCDHQGLRKIIFAHLTGEGKSQTDLRLHPKYVSPADLRQSPDFDRLLAEAIKVRRKDPEKAHFSLTAEQLKAEEVSRRLALYDSICGRLSTRLFQNVLLNQGYLDLDDPDETDRLLDAEEQAQLKNKSPAEIVPALEKKLRKSPDPFHFVALDRVPGSAWFSLGELRACMQDPGLRSDPPQWRDFMKERLAEMPQQYISPEREQSLRDFQDKVRKGNGLEELEKVKSVLAEHREEKIKAIQEANQQGSLAKVGELLNRIVRSHKDENRLREAVAKAVGKKENANDLALAAAIQEVANILQEADEKVLKRMQHGIELARIKPKDYPDDPEFRMLHLDYLESMFPDVYKESLAWQPFPDEEARGVLASYSKVQVAYRTGEPGQFEEASQEFFRVLHETADWILVQGLAERTQSPDVKAAFEKVQDTRKAGEPNGFEHESQDFFQTANQSGAEFASYPGVSTLQLEMTFNRTEPFKWAWIVMIAGVIALLTSMALNSRPFYFLGFGLYFLSLLIQSFGFFSRIYISGRPPVSNMYETVIWVSFMSAIFALVLESIYRQKVILLAGAIVSFFGLVLADQMPLALDPKISPLVPVLRSNYWLTVHVLTIVSSYAGGALAWILGNITLVLLTFGKGTKETLKTLSQFTYRAVQVAVLLLAAGTFLGGWWAAESWGRFWGWDSKEVGALIALVCYVIPLHMRFIGWVKDFGLAVCAVICFLAIIYSWYAVNFVIAAGLHSYGFGGGGYWWVLWTALLNLEWVLVASVLYLTKSWGLAPHNVSEFAHA